MGVFADLKKADYQWMESKSFENILEGARLREVLSQPFNIIAIDTETTGLHWANDKVVSLSFCFDGICGYNVPIRHLVGDNIDMPIEEMAVLFNEVLIGKKVIYFNKLYDKEMLNKETWRFYKKPLEDDGFNFEGIDHDDVQVWAYNYDSDRGLISLKVWSEELLGWKMLTLAETLGGQAGGVQNFSGARICNYAASDAIVTYCLYMKFKELIGNWNKINFIIDLDNDTLDNLRRMMLTAIPVDIDYLEKLNNWCTSQIPEFKDKIYSLAGSRFNPSSSIQLSAVLHRLGVPLKEISEKASKQHKKVIYKVGKDQLKAVRDSHEIVDVLLKMRKITDLHNKLDALGMYYTDDVYDQVFRITDDPYLLINYNAFRVPTGRLASRGNKSKFLKGQSLFSPINIHSVTKAAGCNGALVKCPVENKIAEPFYDDVLICDKVCKNCSVEDCPSDQRACSHLCAGCEYKSQCTVLWVGEISGLMPNPRRVFKAYKGHLYVHADYKSQEVYLPIYWAGEVGMIQKIEDGLDVHQATAAMMLNKPYEQVTRDERKFGKGVRFHLQYGGSAYGLQQRYGKSEEEANKIVEDYYNSNPFLKRWNDSNLETAKRTGYVDTLFGRRRSVAKYLNSPDRKTRSFGMRTVRNSPVQGCLRKNVRILTSDGYLKVGDLFNLQESGKRLPKSVWTGITWASFEILNMGESELVDVYMKNGQILHCDDRHKFYAYKDGKDGFYSIFDLDNEDSYVCMSAPTELEFGFPVKGFNLSKRINRLEKNYFDIQVADSDISELWYWLGFYYGDGYSHSERGSLTYCIGRSKFYLYEKFNTFFTKIGFPSRPLEKSTGSIGDSYRVVYCCKYFLNYLSEHFKIDFSQNAHTKRAPERIWSETLENRIAFIQGILAADGFQPGNPSLKTTGQCLHLCQRGLLEDIQVLARTVGVKSFLYDNTDGSFSLYFRNGPGVRKYFNSVIEKPKRIQDRGSNVGAEVRSRILEWFNQNESSFVGNSKVRAMMSKLRTGKIVSFNWIVDFCETYKIRIDDILYDTTQIKKIVKLGRKETTYTISVHDELHRFDSEGLISKNSGADMIKIAIGRFYRLLPKHMKDKIILLTTIHDELNFSVDPAYLVQAVDLITEAMRFKLPYIDYDFKPAIDIEIGPSWGCLVPKSIF